MVEQADGWRNAWGYWTHTPPPAPPPPVQTEETQVPVPVGDLDRAALLIRMNAIPINKGSGIEHFTEDQFREELGYVRQEVTDMVSRGLVLWATRVKVADGESLIHNDWRDYDAFLDKYFAAGNEWLSWAKFRRTLARLIHYLTRPFVVWQVDTGIKRVEQTIDHAAKNGGLKNLLLDAMKLLNTYAGEYTEKAEEWADKDNAGPFETYVEDKLDDELRDLCRKAENMLIDLQVPFGLRWLFRSGKNSDPRLFRKISNGNKVNQDWVNYFLHRQLAPVLKGVWMGMHKEANERIDLRHRTVVDLDDQFPNTFSELAPRLLKMVAYDRERGRDNVLRAHIKSGGSKTDRAVRWLVSRYLNDPSTAGMVSEKIVEGIGGQELYHLVGQVLRSTRFQWRTRSGPKTNPSDNETSGAKQDFEAMIELLRRDAVEDGLRGKEGDEGLITGEIAAFEKATQDVQGIIAVQLAKLEPFLEEGKEGHTTALTELFASIRGLPITTDADEFIDGDFSAIEDTVGKIEDLLANLMVTGDTPIRRSLERVQAEIELALKWTAGHEHLLDTAQTKLDNVKEAMRLHKEAVEGNEVATRQAILDAHEHARPELEELRDRLIALQARLEKKQCLKREESSEVLLKTASTMLEAVNGALNVPDDIAGFEAADWVEIDTVRTLLTRQIRASIADLCAAPTGLTELLATVRELPIDSEEEAFFEANFGEAAAKVDAIQAARKRLALRGDLPLGKILGQLDQEIQEAILWNGEGQHLLDSAHEKFAAAKNAVGLHKEAGDGNEEATRVAAKSAIKDALPEIKALEQRLIQLRDLFVAEKCLTQDEQADDLLASVNPLLLAVSTARQSMQNAVDDPAQIGGLDLQDWDHLDAVRLLLTRQIQATISDLCAAAELLDGAREQGVSTKNSGFFDAPLPGAEEKASQIQAALGRLAFLGDTHLSRTLGAVLGEIQEANRWTDNAGFCLFNTVLDRLNAAKEAVRVLNEAGEAEREERLQEAKQALELAHPELGWLTLLLLQVREEVAAGRFPLCDSEDKDTHLENLDAMLTAVQSADEMVKDAIADSDLIAEFAPNDWDNIHAVQAILSRHLLDTAHAKLNVAKQAVRLHNEAGAEQKEATLQAAKEAFELALPELVQLEGRLTNIRERLAAGQCLNDGECIDAHCEILNPVLSAVAAARGSMEHAIKGNNTHRIPEFTAREWENLDEVRALLTRQVRASIADLSTEAEAATERSFESGFVRTIQEVCRAVGTNGREGSAIGDWTRALEYIDSSRSVKWRKKNAGPKGQDFGDWVVHVKQAIGTIGQLQQHANSILEQRRSEVVAAATLRQQTRDLYDHSTELAEITRKTHAMRAIKERLHADALESATEVSQFASCHEAHKQAEAEEAFLSGMAYTQALHEYLDTESKVVSQLNHKVDGGFQVIKTELDKWQGLHAECVTLLGQFASLKVTEGAPVNALNLAYGNLLGRSANMLNGVVEHPDLNPEILQAVVENNASWWPGSSHSTKVEGELIKLRNDAAAQVRAHKNVLGEQLWAVIAEIKTHTGELSRQHNRVQEAYADGGFAHVIPPRFGPIPVDGLPDGSSPLLSDDHNALLQALQPQDLNAMEVADRGQAIAAEWKLPELLDEATDLNHHIRQAVGENNEAALITHARATELLRCRYWLLLDKLRKSANLPANDREYLPANDREYLRQQIVQLKARVAQLDRLLQVTLPMRLAEPGISHDDRAFLRTYVSQLALNKIAGGLAPADRDIERYEELRRLLKASIKREIVNGAEPAFLLQMEEVALLNVADLLDRPQPEWIRTQLLTPANEVQHATRGIVNGQRELQGRPQTVSDQPLTKLRAVQTALEGIARAGLTNASWNALTNAQAQLKDATPWNDDVKKAADAPLYQHSRQAVGVLGHALANYHERRREEKNHGLVACVGEMQQKLVVSHERPEHRVTTSTVGWLFSSTWSALKGQSPMQSASLGAKAVDWLVSEPASEGAVKILRTPYHRKKLAGIGLEMVVSAMRGAHDIAE